MEVSDEEDQAGSSNLVMTAPANPAQLRAEELVIFRMPHKHPHMLRRPLQHVDGLSFLDMAVRVYAVSATPAAEDANIVDDDGPVSCQ